MAYTSAGTGAGPGRWRARARGLALGALAIGALACGGAEVAVLHGLPEGEANRVLALLDEHGISGGKTLDNAEAGTWSVAVPGDAAAQAFSLLADSKIPKVDDRRFRDVFGQSQLVVTPGEEKALFLEALQGEITHTLEGVPGVIQARVHLVLPEQDLAGRPSGVAKAAVLLEYQADAPGSRPLGTAEIQALVGHAVEGLDPRAVAVVQKPAATAPAPGSGGLPALPADLGLVRVGPLLMEARALAFLKAFAATAAALIALLGACVLWQGRLIRGLQGELSRSGRGRERKAAVAQLPAGGEA